MTSQNGIGPSLSRIITTGTGTTVNSEKWDSPEEKARRKAEKRERFGPTWQERKRLEKQGQERMFNERTDEGSEKSIQR